MSETTTQQQPFRVEAVETDLGERLRIVGPGLSGNPTHDAAYRERLEAFAAAYNHGWREREKQGASHA